METIGQTKDATAFWKHCTTALCTLLLAMTGNTIADYDSFVRKDELPVLAPFAGKAEERIMSHIQRSESALIKMVDTLDSLNSRVTKQAHEQNLRMTILEEHVNAKR